MVDKTLFSFLFQQNVFQNVFQSLFRNLVREITPRKTVCLPHMLFLILFHMNNCMMGWKLEFLEGLRFSCWCMPANLNIKSDGNQQLENVQSALCWNAHLSECRRSLAPTKVVWDNKRVCFESSELFFFFLMCKVLNWLFWNQVSCFSMKTDVAEWEQNIDQPAFLTVLNHHAPDLLVLTVPFCVDGHLS